MAMRLDMGSRAGGFLGEGALVACLRRFVRFPSEQTAQQEKDPQIARFVRECAAPLAAEIGLACRYDGMGNLLLEAGPQSGQSLLFATYAMTHPAAKMTDPFAGLIIETAGGPAVRGRGVAEQKTAMTAAFAAVAEAVARGALTGRLSLAVLTAGETGRHDAIESLLGMMDHKPDQAIVCIGTDCRIAVGNKGRIDFDVLVHGRTSHSSAPWHGVNAIAGAQKLVSLLDELKLGAADHPKFGPATLTPTAIESFPKATHTVPDCVRVTYDRRLLPGEDPAAAFASIKAAISLPPPWTAECQPGPVMYPNEISTSSAFMQNLRAAFEGAGYPVPDDFYCNFALDAGYLSRNGVAAVMLGPGEVDQFHSSEEAVLISDLLKMSRVYYGVIEQCVGQYSNPKATAPLRA